MALAKGAYSDQKPGEHQNGLDKRRHIKAPMQ